MRYALVFFFALFFLPTQLCASINPDALPNFAQEERAKALQKQFRCVVCQGQSLDDSNAALAADMRKLIRVRIQMGDSDAQITDYLVSRYGDFVLMKPPVRGDTILLWLMPFAVLFIGGQTVFFVLRRPKSRNSD